MSTSEQYRAKAAELRAILADAPHSPKETSELRTLEQSYTTLAENGEWMALNLDRTIQRGEDDDNHAVFPDDGERILSGVGLDHAVEYDSHQASTRTVRLCEYHL